MRASVRCYPRLIGLFLCWGIHGAAVAEQAGERLWSMAPLSDDLPPELAEDNWSRTPVDRYVLARLRKAALEPQGEASRFTLIRRASMGLVGLSPGVETIEAFVADTSPGAYERLLDRLLASPHYGERWGRHWLDVVRFGESDGILTVNEDKVRGDAWKFRDAVIHAFNRDLPFDRFVRYHLSGPDADDPGRADYAALRQFMHLGTRLQNNADPNDKQFHRLDDMVSTTGTAFLGFSFGCARCHDHPVDPMSTEEYYQFTAFFFDQFREEPKASARKIALRITEPRVLLKGSWQSPGKPVDPGFLKVLTAKDAHHWRKAGRNELQALGDWLTDHENGAGELLARVIVNRLWHHHFGQGLVKTPNDFGNLGAAPSHPGLLDYLAARLIEGGWRLKPIHRLIMTSAAYRQRGSNETAALEIDADNALLWHRRPHRLEAEVIRDQMLQAAGVLRREMFGPSISIGNYKKEVQDDENSWRRSIYLQVHRSARHPTLSLFDPPDTERSVGSRSTGSAPEGALFALNAPFAWEMAGRLADRIAREVGDERGPQIRHAYLLTLSRPPSEAEVEIGRRVLSSAREGSLMQYCHLLLGLNEFVYVD
jgi:hypothetical protein